VIPLGEFGQDIPQSVARVTGYAANHAQQVDLLSEWIYGASPDAQKRFSAQVEIASHLAHLIDSAGDAVDGRMLKAYRDAIKDIVERVDKVYGNEQIDILAGIRRIIEERAVELEAEKWRARVE